jgi:CHAT domain-containing protein
MWEWYGGRTARIPDQAANWSWDGLQKKIFQPVDFSVTSTRLVYAAFEDRLQVWTTQADAIKGYSIKIKQADLEKQVNDFALQCATAPTYIYSMDELRKSGEPLSTLFLQPVHAELEASHNILVELDPRLARLPVEALMMPGGRYFGEEYSITISPGLFRENDLRPAPHVAPSWSVLVATGAPSRGPSHLEGWDDFGSGVREVFKNTAFASAEQDSWKTVSGRLRNSDVFIFVGHGVPQGTNTALEWGNLLLNAKAFPPETLQRLHFAVLAACSSGKGGQSPLMETGSLIHAFHAGGVPSILVTRWDVDPEATAALLKSFFIHLGQSEEIPSAMYHARNDFRRLLLSNVSYRHPYYWAGLELVSRVN